MDLERIGQKKSCIVIMPFRDDLMPHFELIRRCGEELRLNVERVDTALFAGTILQAIARLLAKADLIVADLTDANANVIYELAIAHCLGKRVVHVSNDMNSIPFDIRTYPVFPIDPTSPQRIEQLRKGMRSVLESTYVVGPLGGAVILGEKTFPRRLISLFIDVSPLIGLALLWWRGSDSGIAEEQIGLRLILVIIAYMIYIGATTAALGGTLGQRLLKLKVLTLDGEKLSFWYAVGRAALASILTAFTYGIGFLWSLKSPGFRALHDIASRTMVVKR